VFVKMWRFFTIMLTALSMGMSFCHLLELPPRVFYFDVIKIIGMSLLLLSVLVEPPQTLASRRNHA
jgi:uncharacterized membrane protein